MQKSSFQDGLSVFTLQLIMFFDNQQPEPLNWNDRFACKEKLYSLPLKIGTKQRRKKCARIESIEPSSLNMQISRKGFAKKLENYAKK